MAGIGAAKGHLLQKRKPKLLPVLHMQAVTQNKATT